MFLVWDSSLPLLTLRIPVKHFVISLARYCKSTGLQGSNYGPTHRDEFFNRREIIIHDSDEVNKNRLLTFALQQTVKQLVQLCALWLLIQGILDRYLIRLGSPQENYIQDELKQLFVDLGGHERQRFIVLQNFILQQAINL